MESFFRAFPEAVNEAEAYYFKLANHKERQSPNKDTDLAKFNIYGYMAHYVGKTLNIRPAEILDTWGVPELIVTFGEYINEVCNQNYEQWKSYSPEVRNKIKKPQKRVVRFIAPDEMTDELREEDG